MSEGGRKKNILRGDIFYGWPLGSNDSNAPSRSNEVRIEKMLKNMAYSHSILKVR